MKKLITRLYLIPVLLILCCSGSGPESTGASDSGETILPVSSESHLFRQASDEIERSFSTEAGKTYRITTSAPSTSDSAFADTVLILRDAAGNELARNDDKNPSLAGISLEELKKNPLKMARTLLTLDPDELEGDHFSEITWQAPLSGTYRIQVKPHDGNPWSMGSFTLQVTEL